MTSIDSHFAPDVIEGIKVGDKVYHVTNLEQNWDIPHGFSVQGANNAEMLISPAKRLLSNGNPKKKVCTPSTAPISARHCTRKCKDTSEPPYAILR